MSSLVVGFTKRMHKRAASAQRETTPNSAVPDEKREKRSGPNEEVQKCTTMVTLDSPKKASNALSDLNDTAQDASKEAVALLEDGILVEGPHSAGNIVGKAPSIETTVGPLILAR